MEQGKYLSAEEIAELQRKLEYLKTVRRAEVAEQIKQARAFGDISENAEYDEAKNDQAEIEREITITEDTLRRAILIDDNAVDTQTVSIGTVVKVRDEATGEVILYQIKGSMAADDDEGSEIRKITNDSPVAKALLGKKMGRIAQVQAPKGIIKLKIIEITR